jgi:hypothetical protein
MVMYSFKIRSYSLGCSTIAEFGVRSVVSTWAFLKGLKDTQSTQKKLICVDLERSANMAPAEIAAAQNSIPTLFSFPFLFPLFPAPSLFCFLNLF